MSIGPSGAVVGGNVTVAASGGTAIFSNLSLTQAGTYRLVVTLASASVLTMPFVVAAAAAARVAILQEPTNVLAGDTVTLEAAVMDIYGNLCTDDTSAPRLLIGQGPSGGALQVLSQSSAGGVTNFAARLTTVGSYTLQVSDGRLLGDTSGAFQVGAKSGSGRVIFVQHPTAPAAGAPFWPAVSVFYADAFGNALAGAVATIRVVSGNGTLMGKTSVPVINGMATFGNLSIAKTGNYLLQANVGALSVVSARITVTPPATQLKAGVVQNVAAGAVIPGVVVQAGDCRGKVVGSDRSFVTVSLVGGEVDGDDAGAGGEWGGAVCGVVDCEGGEFSVGVQRWGAEGGDE